MRNVTTVLQSCPANGCLHLVLYFFLFFLIKVLIDLLVNLFFLFIKSKDCCPIMIFTTVLGSCTATRCFHLFFFFVFFLFFCFLFCFEFFLLLLFFLFFFLNFVM